MKKISQNSISLSILGFKLQNHLQEIPFVKGFPTTLGAYPKFSKIFNFDFVEIYF